MSNQGTSNQSHGRDDNDKSVTSCPPTRVPDLVEEEQHIPTHHHHQRQPLPPLPRQGERQTSQGTNSSTNTTELELASMLPSKWNVPKHHAHVRREKNALRLIGCLQDKQVQHDSNNNNTVLVVTNKPIPMEALHSIVVEKQATRLDSLALHHSQQDQVHVYYFEVTIQKGVTWVGLVPSRQLQGPVTLGRFPGDFRGSVGMSSTGSFYSSGKQKQDHFQLQEQVADPLMQRRFTERDTIGCGLEIREATATSVFFTKNGSMWLPPVRVTELQTHGDWYFPAVGVAAAGGDVFANFGISYPFRWKGSDNHVLFSPREMVMAPSSTANNTLPAEASNVTAGESTTLESLVSRYEAAAPHPTPGSTRTQQSPPPIIIETVETNSQQTSASAVEARINEMRREQGAIGRPGLPEEASPQSLTANRVIVENDATEKVPAFPMAAGESTGRPEKGRLDHNDLESKLQSVALQQRSSALDDSFQAEFAPDIQEPVDPSLQPRRRQQQQRPNARNLDLPRERGMNQTPDAAAVIPPTQGAVSIPSPHITAKATPSQQQQQGAHVRDLITSYENGRKTAPKDSSPRPTSMENVESIPSRQPQTGAATATTPIQPPVPPQNAFARNPVVSPENAASIPSHNVASIPPPSIALALGQHVAAMPPQQQNVASLPPRRHGGDLSDSFGSSFSSRTGGRHQSNESFVGGYVASPSDLDKKMPAKPASDGRLDVGELGYAPSIRRTSDSSNPMQSSAGIYGRPSDRNVRLDEDFPNESAISQFLGSSPYAMKPTTTDFTGRVGAFQVNEPAAGRVGAFSVESSSVSLMDRREIDYATECARNLRECCDSNNVSFAQDLLEICRTKQKDIMKTLQEGMIKMDDPAMEAPLNELIILNESLLEAIKVAEGQGSNEPAPEPSVVMIPDPSSGPNEPGTPVQAPTGSLEIEKLVDRKDVFSLICMLRAQGDKRLDAAMALMRFARDAERSQTVEKERVRDEISSSGGMHSLLALFRSQGTARELKVVVALAVAYLLPSFVSSTAPSSSIGLKIVECLRFLFSTAPVTPKGEEISRAEMCHASAMGVHTFWFNVLSSLLSRKQDASSSSNAPNEPLKRPSLRMRKSRAMFRQTTGETVFDRRREVLELQELLELTVSLIVEMAKTSDRTDVALQVRHPNANFVPLVEQMSAIVQQMCAIDMARPIAVREGVLGILVMWMRSQDREKIRCAAISVNELTSTLDNYMAGWIHSQIVNEGALQEIVTLAVSKAAEHDVRLAVAEILRSLCVAPHTRAAVVESNCIHCLINLLYEFEDSSTQKVAYAAGSALLQLVSGAMTRSSVFSSDTFEIEDSVSVSPDKRDDVISNVVDGGAIFQFVAMAKRSPKGKLRSMSVEALRILSEDTHSSRKTRLRLCDDGAGEALGRIMNEDVEGSGSTTSLVQFVRNERGREMAPKDSLVQELHHALCTWANILDRDSKSSSSLALTHQISTVVRLEGEEETLVKGCTQFVEVGGLESLLKIATLPFETQDQGSSESLSESDLAVEACRSLASMSPLLLSNAAASRGYAGWSAVVLQALTRVFYSVIESEGTSGSELSSELKFDALRGIGALAVYEPHKLVIVDTFLPTLFHTRTGRGDDPTYVSGAAGLVCASLGVSDDDFAKKIAGNDPTLMGDWFCMQRSILLQSMARAEILTVLSKVWERPFKDLLQAGQVPSGLWRSTSRDSQRSKESGASSGQLSTSRSEETGGELQTLDDLFACLGFESEGPDLMNTILEQYHDVYETQPRNGRHPFLPEVIRSWTSNDPKAESLLSSHVYPLNSTSAEKKWMLSHRRFEQDKSKPSALGFSGRLVSKHVQQLLDSCIPSRLIQHDVLPVFDLRPESSFDFRSLVMPQRRYFSFRREGQLVSQLCDTNSPFVDSDDAHWTLAFTNSSFAGEFSETLVQALYRSPMIRGISFTRDDNWKSVWGTEGEEEGHDNSGLLANLAGSLPPWVSSVVYDKTLNDFSLTSLADILETMGRLSASQASANEEGVRDVSQLGQRQGSFLSFAILNSPHLGFEAWGRFFDLLGRGPERSSSLKAHPLETLRILDLSGNNLGDSLCAAVLARVLDRRSGSRLEQLDLSRNGIGRGSQVAKVLRGYVDRHRQNQSAGHVTKGSWKAPLVQLNLSSNELHTGSLPLEIVALLKHDALSLRSLDMSDNGLQCQGYEFTEVLVGSLVKNTSLHHLNLSGNDFSPQCIDGVLYGLARAETDSSLAFLRLNNNSPPLSEAQWQALDGIEKASRTILLQRYLNEKDRINSGELDEMEIGDDGPMPSLQENAPTHTPRPALLKSSSDHSGSMFSGSEALTAASDDGSGRRTSRTLRRSSSGGRKGENMITVLFSAPLVFRDEDNKYRPFAKLDFDMERELLWQCLKEARRDIELFFDNATHDRLLAAKAKGSSCLHYSGHGHISHLPFENGKGGPNWLEVEVLKNLLEKNDGAPFKFVFVSACYSGLAGETFANAGVPHVVCCQQESELKDAAALAFTRQFYLTLAMGHTVKESFEQGCKAVSATPGLRNADLEMQKFILLPRGGNHDVPIFVDAKRVREWPRTTSGSSRNLQRGKSSRQRGLQQQEVPRSRSIYLGGTRSSELSVRNMMQEDPSPTPPQFFIGREVDMYHVLNSILSTRLVSVVGEKGLGRSSLVYALCHYINERRSTILEVDQIFFVRAKQNRGSNRFLAVLRELLKKLVQDRPGGVQEGLGDMDMETLINAIIKCLNKAKALLVIDRTEFLEGSDDQQDLLVFLSNLFQESKTQHVRVLLTGREPLGIPAIGGEPERPYRLGPLDFQNTVRLFSNLCPHLHTPADRQRFVQRIVTDDHQAELFPTNRDVTERTSLLFRALGNGVPSRIEKKAFTIAHEDLERLGLDAL